MDGTVGRTGGLVFVRAKKFERQSVCACADFKWRKALGEPAVNGVP